MPASFNTPNLAPPSRLKNSLGISSSLAVLLLFWAITYLIRIFDWGKGVERALMLLIVLLVTCILLRLPPTSLRRSWQWREYLFAILLSVALIWHLLSFYQNFLNPHLGDFAISTINAGRLMLAGINPYRFPVDPIGGEYSGYKYLPMMAITFLPLSEVLGMQGVVATNLLLDLTTILLMYLLGLRVGTPTIGLFSALLYSVTPYVPLEIFVNGSTDLAAVVPLLVALLLVEKKQAWAGFCIGLSISVKLSPGAFLAICCIPKSGRLSYLGGLGVGLLPTILYLAMSPMELISNIILYVAKRPIDSTSWMYGLQWSSEYRLLAFAALVAILLFVGGHVWLRDTSLLESCGMSVACIVIAMLSGPVVHGNYQLWWLPFFALLVARTTPTLQSKKAWESREGRMKWDNAIKK